MFLFSLQDQDFHAKCLAETNTDWSAAKIRQMAKTLESSEAIAKHMRILPMSQSQAQVNHLRQQWFDSAQYKNNIQKRKPSHLTGQSKVPSSKKHQHNKIT